MPGTPVVAGAAVAAVAVAVAAGTVAAVAVAVAAGTVAVVAAGTVVAVAGEDPGLAGADPAGATGALRLLPVSLASAFDIGTVSARGDADLLHEEVS
jgi:hypothetical protein